MKELLSHKRTLSILALGAVLLLAAFLRLWNLDATEFKYDEARICNLAADFVDTGRPPLRGMGSSTGIDNPPFGVYLMSLPVLISRDPIVPTAFVALINVAGVWGCYSLGRRYWGKGVGLVSATLLAVSPWAVFYSRKVWAQDLLVPVVVLFFALLLSWLVDRRSWGLVGAIVAWVISTQIHFAATALAPVLALAVIWNAIALLRRRQAAPLWKPLWIGAGIGVLLYAPYILSDAVAGWHNLRALVETVQAPSQAHPEAIRYALLNIGGREIHALAGAQRFRDFLGGILDLSYWPDRVEEALAVISVPYLALRWWSRQKEGQSAAADALLAVWLLASVAFFIRAKSEVYPHYLLPLYPAPYLGLAILGMDLAHHDFRLLWQRRTARILGLLSLTTLAAWQIYLSLSIHAFVEQHYTPGGMGVPIGILRQVTRQANRYARAWDNREVVILCPGDDPAIDECPAVFHFLTSRSLDARFADQDASLLFPRSEADTLIVLAPSLDPLGAESRASAELPQHAQALPDESIPLREGIGAYRFYRLPAGFAPLPPVQPESGPAQLANGVSLLGYELSGGITPSRLLRLSLYWRVDRVPQDPPPQGYSFANHLLAADGQRLGQEDGPGHRVQLWQAGDTIVSWFDLALDPELPPPPYRLRVGMYVYMPPDQFQAVSVMDPEGRRIGDAVEWTLR